VCLGSTNVAGGPRARRRRSRANGAQRHHPRTSSRHDAVVAETGPLIDLHDLVGGHDCLHPDASGHDDIATAFDAVIDAAEVIQPG